MQLLYTPYVPDRNESLLLSNRRILADQMQFLSARLPGRSRLRNYDASPSTGRCSRHVSWCAQRVVEVADFT